MTFRFQLSAIHQLRQLERDEAAAALAEIDAAVSQIDVQRHTLALQRDSLRQAQRSLRSGIITAHELKSQVDFDLALRHTDADLLQQREALLIQVQQAHHRLVAAQQEVAKLEKLQQLQRARYEAEMRQREQREHDAIMTARQTK